MESTCQSQPSQPFGGHARWNILMRAAFIWPPALGAGLAMRLAMLKHLFLVDGDSLIYGELARNLLLHGRYGQTLDSGAIAPTLIRLPGYPIFLASCFRFFGLENYFAATVVQIVLELFGCVLLAQFAYRIAPPRLAAGARLAALWIAILCPFTASYTATPMAETPTLFVLALAMWSMERFTSRLQWRYALAFTFAVAYAGLLRPDGILAVAAFAPALLLSLRRSGVWAIPRRRLAAIATACALLAAAPFAVWTWRNWRTFHVFEPLAPRYASDPGQPIYPGWQRWMKTWCLDFSSTYEIYWPVPGDSIDLGQLPARAFDTPAQYAETARLFADYNQRIPVKDLSPQADADFGRLAAERIAAHPLRYYLWLPLGRVADMWLRPRVENLNVDIDWWDYARHRAETRFCLRYAALNLLYLALAAAGFALRPRFRWTLVGYMILRSMLLMTVEAPETRYTLECFPMLFALGGIALSAAARWLASKLASQQVGKSADAR
jgi:hypothetical protein